MQEQNERWQVGTGTLIGVVIGLILGFLIFNQPPLLLAICTAIGASVDSWLYHQENKAPPR